MNFKDYGIEVNELAKGNVKTKCPNCAPYKSNPNDTCLSVNIPEKIWNCHKCGWTGSLNSSVKGSYEPFKPIKTSQPSQYKETPLKDLSSASIGFMEKRGISEETLRKEGIKIASKWLGNLNKEKNMIAFPFFKGNKRVATKYRDSLKNMTQDAGGEKCFYRFDEIIGAKDIYITEGEIDALTLIECGYGKGVTSVPDGAPNPTMNNLDTKFSYFTEEAMNVLDQAERVYLVVDNDENGKFLENELKRRIGIDKCLYVEYPSGCKDINDVLVKFDKDAVKGVIDSAKEYPVDGIKSFKDYANDIYDLHQGISGEYYETGWDNMDKHLKIKTGQLNIVTGTPGSGKSEWVDDLMINTIQKYDLKWGVFSPENYPPQVYFKKLSEKYLNKSFDATTQHELLLSIDDVSENVKLIVDNDEDEVTIDYLFERIRTLVFRFGIKGVIIDPWNEIEHNIGAREDIYLNKVLRKIKRFIRKYDLSFWLIAHPRNPKKNADGTYPKITAYDIAGGYAWYAKADNVFSVYRDKTKLGSPVEVHIQKIKQKTDGQLGIATFYYQIDTGRYQSYRSSLEEGQVVDRGGVNVNGVKKEFENEEEW